MGERRGTKALELWCRRITEGYPGVNVQNMTTSWRDGLAFCAMIHHFRPDLVDFNSLNKDDVYGNNELAFRTAEEHLGIPALLDAEDMASCAVPDRLSILTYLSQFYQTFGGLSPSRTALKRTSGESDERLASVSGSPQPKVGVRLGVQRKEPCVVCGLPVFLAEKLVISRSLYHRTCFRCARCNNQLMLGNYYETEEGQYCCETCPDEENVVVSAPVMHQDYNQAAVVPRGGGTPLEFHYRPPPSPTYKRALSDEEKSSKRAGVVVSNEASKVRLNFMTSHLLAGNENENENEEQQRLPADSPHPPDAETTEKTVRCTPREPYDEGEPRAGAENSHFSRREFVGGLNRDRKDDKIAFSATHDVEEDIKDVNSDGCSLDSKYSLAAANQRTIGKSRGEGGVVIKSTEDHTKDSDTELNIPEEGERLSLVQQRLKIFENSMSNESSPNSSRRELSDVASITKKKKGRDKEIGIETETETETVTETVTVMNIEKDNADEVSATGEDSSIKTFEEGKKIYVSLPEASPIEGPSIDITQVDSTPFEEHSEPVENPAKEEEEGKEEYEEDKVSVKVIPDSEETQNLGTSVIEAPGIDLSGGGGDYPEDLNPFQSDEDEKEKKPKQKKTPSTNPFGSSDEDEEPEDNVAAPRPAARSNTSSGNKIEAQLPARRRLQAPQINLNPFWSDEEEEEEGGDSDGEHEPGKPVPKPRTRRTTPEPSPVPRKTSLDRGGLYSSNTSIASTGSHKTPGGTYRKKKPAPPPPLARDTFSPTSTFDTLVTHSPDDHQLAKAAPLRTPRIRKTKPAPPMPISTSTPQSLTDVFPIEEKESAIWDDQKSSKDETNRNRQSLSGVPPELDDSGHRFSATFIDKSAQGKWKRKKGPAPPRPIPHKRKIKVMSVKDVKLELDQIELQQQGLEKQGVRLEQLIRDKSETGQENEEFMSLRVDVEELVLELFALVNEKNELFRRQAELMLLRRQQRLEEEHADVEYQIRCLMSQPEATKTDSDKQREEVLIQRLVEIVERRNEIVECLEMDRRREVEEDRSINEQMGLFAAKSKGDLTASNDNVNSSTVSKKEKLKEKVKEKKVKKSQKKDADKDVDETEMKLKRHKKKWF